MKSIYPCPACGAKTLEWAEGWRGSVGSLSCQNVRCTSKATGDGIEASTEAEAYEQLKRRVEEEARE